MRAIGVGADDDDDDLERSVDTPTAPAFDPVTALILAGYGFQAYLSPARGAYWETFSAAVPGSQVSERARQTITTRVAYPSTDAIARTACGVFMVHVEAVRAAGGARPLPDKFYVVAVLNRALHEDALKGGRADFSLLQRAGAGCGADDALVLAVYESRAAYASGGSVLGEARVPLGELVAAARGQPGGARGEPALALFEPVSEDRASEDFFEADLLPEGMSLPFRLPTMKGKDARERFARDVHGTAAEIQIAYVPFDAPAGCEGEEEEDEDEGEGGEGGAEVSEAEVTAISESMKDGEMPLDWQRLAKELHATVSSLRDSSLRPAAGYIREDMPKAMFIASPDTDSEVWLWHDKVNKNVVVSYRGTEQVCCLAAHRLPAFCVGALRTRPDKILRHPSLAPLTQTKWKDFVTDSLVFLQAWSPGAPVTLDIAPGRTMGLDMWDVVLYGSKKGLEDDVSAMSCCHWGFLRAYLSLRDSVDHALAQFTDNFSDGYSYYFTGHSLGGALATLSAADTQARHGGPGASLDVTMINYGSPRVGNRAFCREYNRLVPNSFRVVNGSDLVARMPQTPSRLRGGFRHVGRTCLVDETGSVWVQGADGDVSSTFPPPDMDRLSGLLAREREMWQLLISGKSLGHHMEDSYFLSLKGVVEQLFA
jgi:hypothetical protein